MSATNLIHTATLADLEPNFAVELYRPAYRSRLRYQGSHLRTLLRPSRSPESTRRYSHGDPVNLIDWKAFARTDQLLVREQRDEVNAKVAILLDANPSMFWPTPPVIDAAQLGRKPTKFELAVRIACNLAYSHARLGDLSDLIVVESSTLSTTPPKFSPKSPTDVLGLFHEVAAAQFAPGRLLAHCHNEAHPRLPYDIAYCLSDALDFEPTGLQSVPAYWRGLIHVLSTLELDLAWLSPKARYFDETRVPLEYRAKELREQNRYATELLTWKAKLELTLQQFHAHYFAASDATTITQFHHTLSHAVGIVDLRGLRL